MSLSLYMNHHVHAAITAGLRQRGVDVLTALEDGAAEADDDWIIDRATALGRIVFSHDRDMLAVSAHRQHASIAFSGVIYAHQLRITIGQAIEDLELMCKVYDPQDMVGRVEHLPIR